MERTFTCQYVIVEPFVAEINYPAVEKEAPSFIEALKKLRPLIYNSLVVFTDKALCSLFERADDLG